LTRFAQFSSAARALSGFRLRDILFFPLSLLLAGGMVMLALSPVLGRLPSGPVAGDGVNYKRIVVKDAYLNKVVGGGETTTELLRGRDGSFGLYIEAGEGALGDAIEMGPHFQLNADLEQNFSGKRLRITARIRPAGDKGALQAAVNYSAGRAGESGWQVFDLAPQATDFSFEYDVPVHRGDQGLDYLGVRPVVPEKSRAIIVESLTLEQIGPAAP
jgi:hypothetical protein